MDFPTTAATYPLKMGNGLSANESLWKRAPTRMPDGTCLCDFMLLIPKLNKRNHPQRLERVARISAVLSQFDQTVVFADLNMKLNLLWVSYKPAPGSCIAIATAIQEWVPEAKLIAMKLD